MLITLFILLLLLSGVVFVIPPRFKVVYIAVILIGLAGIAVYWATQALLFQNFLELEISLPSSWHARLNIDRLSAFFIFLASIVFTIIALYNISYYKDDRERTPIRLSFQLFNFIMLFFSILLVLAARDGFVFLFAWEFMTLTTFLLMTYNARKRSIIKTATSFLIQMHIGFFLILFAFAEVENQTGAFSFDALYQYFATHKGFLVLFLFLIGFGVKAGFVPLHTWLPESYSVACSNVSALMSGVVTKMGIYGIFRVLTYVQANHFTIALIILAVSIITALYGVVMSALQNDLKKLLAYSSIENMGIIGLGVGLGLLGQSVNNDLLTISGYSAALIHIFSHGLVKPLLFLSGGSVCERTGTQSLTQMGGVIKLMPQTSLLFLVGSMCICALPPWGNFISEFILYSGAFKSISGWGYTITSAAVAVVVTLCLAGGISILAFSKAFGIGFLGQARSNITASENKRYPLFIMLILAVLLLLVGVFPTILASPAYKVIASSFTIPEAVFIRQSMLYSLGRLSLTLGIFILLVLAILYIRRMVIGKQPATGDTWACGSTVNSPKIQYTSTSFSAEFASLVKPADKRKQRGKQIAETDYFPQEFKVKNHLLDVFKQRMMPIMYQVGRNLNKLAILQTGKVHHYVLYALLFMLLIFVLSFFELI